MKEVVIAAIFGALLIFVGAFMFIAFVAFWMASWDFFARLVGPGMYPTP